MARHKAPVGAYGPLFVHTRTLVQAIDPAVDADTVATMLLGAIAPPILDRVRRVQGGDVDVVVSALLAVLRGVTS